MAVISKEGRRPPDVLVLRLLCEPELGRAFSGLQVAGVKCLGRNKCWERVPGQGSQARDLEGTRDLAGTGRRACRLSGKGRAGLGPRRAPTARREWRVLRRPPSCRPRGRGGCQCPRAKAPGAGPASAAASPSHVRSPRPRGTCPGVPFLESGKDKCHLSCSSPASRAVSADAPRSWLLPAPASVPSTPAAASPQRGDGARPRGRWPGPGDAWGHAPHRRPGCRPPLRPLPPAGAGERWTSSQQRSSLRSGPEPLKRS